jgi:hypothetical protein
MNDEASEQFKLYIRALMKKIPNLSYGKAEGFYEEKGGVLYLLSPEELGINQTEIFAGLQDTLKEVDKLLAYK